MTEPSAVDIQEIQKRTSEEVMGIRDRDGRLVFAHMDPKYIGEMFVSLCQAGRFAPYSLARFVDVGEVSRLGARLKEQAAYVKASDEMQDDLAEQLATLQAQHDALREAVREIGERSGYGIDPRD